jgi:hypothetical protein
VNWLQPQQIMSSPCWRMSSKSISIMQPTQWKGQMRLSSNT